MINIIVIIISSSSSIIIIISYQVNFVYTLQMVKLEFAHYDLKLRGTISAKDFALSMVASADMKNLNKLLDRVDDLDNEPHLGNIRITPEEFKNFSELRRKLQPFSLALFSFGQINGLLTRKDLQRAAEQVGVYNRPFLIILHLMSILLHEEFHYFALTSSCLPVCCSFCKLTSKMVDQIQHSHHMFD